MWTPMLMPKLRSPLRNLSNAKFNSTNKLLRSTLYGKKRSKLSHQPVQATDPTLCCRTVLICFTIALSSLAVYLVFAALMVREPGLASTPLVKYHHLGGWLAGFLAFIHSFDKSWHSLVSGFGSESVFLGLSLIFSWCRWFYLSCQLASFSIRKIMLSSSTISHFSFPFPFQLSSIIHSRFLKNRWYIIISLPFQFIWWLFTQSHLISHTLCDVLSAPFFCDMWDICVEKFFFFSSSFFSSHWQVRVCSSINYSHHRTHLLLLWVFLVCWGLVFLNGFIHSFIHSFWVLH